MTPLLKQSPCDDCADVESAKCWCKKYEAADGIISVAVDTIESLRTYDGMKKVPAFVRHELILDLAAAFDNALYELGARLDIAEFKRRATEKERGT
jgi:hypothetical protein